MNAPNHGALDDTVYPHFVLCATPCMMNKRFQGKPLPFNGPGRRANRAAERMVDHHGLQFDHQHSFK
jgi:hypothetical protein